MIPPLSKKAIESFREAWRTTQQRLRFGAAMPRVEKPTKRKFA
jgi:hypothetical protein